MMKTAEQFMEGFMAKLDSGVYVKDNLPNSGLDLDSDSVRQQLESYTQLLRSELGQMIMEDGEL